MTFFGGMVKQHLRRKLPDVLEKGVSRLATQWADKLNTAIEHLADASLSTMNAELKTIETLLHDNSSVLAEINELLEQTREIQEHLRQSCLSTASSVKPCACREIASE
jgi:hypothetical protein